MGEYLAGERRRVRGVQKDEIEVQYKTSHPLCSKEEEEEKEEILCEYGGEEKECRENEEKKRMITRHTPCSSSFPCVRRNGCSQPCV